MVKDITSFLSSLVERMRFLITYNKYIKTQRIQSNIRRILIGSMLTFIDHTSFPIVVKFHWGFLLHSLFLPVFHFQVLIKYTIIGLLFCVHCVDLGVFTRLRHAVNAKGESFFIQRLDISGKKLYHSWRRRRPWWWLWCVMLSNYNGWILLYPKRQVCGECEFVG